MTTWVDPEYIMLNKSEKGKYCMISLVYGIQKTKQMNKQIKNSYKYGDKRAVAKEGIKK